MNFNDALTYAKNNYVPEEFETKLVLGITYDSDDDGNDYPVHVITLSYIPDDQKNKDQKVQAGEAYEAYVLHYGIPDYVDASDNLEYTQAATPSELLAYLPASAANLNYQVYTPADGELDIDLIPLLGTLFPNLPKPAAKTYKKKVIAAIEQHNKDVLSPVTNKQSSGSVMQPAVVTSNKIDTYFNANPAMTIHQAYAHILANFNDFAGSLDRQVLAACGTPQTSDIDVYVIALTAMPATFRDDSPQNTDKDGNVCPQYRFHLQGGSLTKPATVVADYHANSVQELLDILPPIFDHIKFRVHIMGNGHRRQTAGQVLCRMFPQLLKQEVDITSEADLMAFKAAAYQVIQKSNF